MINLLKKLVGKKRKPNIREASTDQLKNIKLTANIDDNISRLKITMSSSYDIVTRELEIGAHGIRASLIYIDNLVNSIVVQDNILRPLTIYSLNEPKGPGRIDINKLKDSMISIGEIKEAESFDDIVLAILSGNVFLCIQGYDKGLLIGAKYYHGRTIGEPNTESSIRGPQESFVEILKVNIGLIRRRLRDPNLAIDAFKIGKRAKSDLAIAYIRGLADPEIVEQIKQRVLKLDLDGQISAIQIGQMILDNPNSIFPMSQITERPDKVVSALMDGRVMLLLEGAPDALLLPVTLPILMQSADDYFESWIISSFIRISRYMCLFISTLFPASYIAIATFNPGMLPTNLALSMAANRTGVPFTAAIEALIMEFTIEILQEAGVRLPKVIGQTVSIVGGLVIGQSAVQAGLVGPIMVIVVALTALASFTIPDYSLGLATRFLRLPFIILAISFGGFGIAIGMLTLITYLSSLKSFGIRYLAPITPFNLKDWTDTLIRGSNPGQNKRPEFLKTQARGKSKALKEAKADEG